MVKSQYDLVPFSKSIFIFCSRRSNRFKVLYWDGEVGYSTRGMKIENYPAKRC
ncbi:MAG: IS66 family insertion sequence element accessory protein TnpB [Streptococcus salivarius]|uniref:transposase n=1 Tax=Streptococcus salivarius TaxID=1304 RepID=UPI001E5EC33D|nr:transposase [Streptococcus salivarius]MDU2714262.1 IS66 family insertion sequence element accessory protein TnpB [Streptococcus salivarius]